jgi:predicted transcriptional regulator
MPVLPRIDELLDALINGYEDVIRRSCDMQRTIARGVPIEAVRSILDTTADLTRDIAAVQLSGARWLLDS